MKRYKLFVLLFIPLISSCFDDKGNYDYHEVAEITIEGLPELLEVVGGAEHIVAAPTVKSSLEGIITEDNPNFTFTYKMELKSGGTIVNGAYWGVTLNKNGRKDVDTLATFAANTYLCMFIVTDIRTGRERIIHWGPRTLDLDIIFYDDLVMSDDDLCIPHVDMHNRSFVIEPMKELAPYKMHPVLKKRMVEL